MSNDYHSGKKPNSCYLRLVKPLVYVDKFSDPKRKKLNHDTSMMFSFIYDAEHGLNPKIFVYKNKKWEQIGYAFRYSDDRERLRIMTTKNEWSTTDFCCDVINTINQICFNQGSY